MSAKYGFADLEIGEEMYVPGDAECIKRAASMWGTRYGVWLTTRKTAGGRIVTRTAERKSDTPQQKSRDEKHAIASRTHDALEALATVVFKLRARVDELEQALDGGEFRRAGQ